MSCNVFVCLKSVSHTRTHTHRTTKCATTNTYAFTYMGACMSVHVCARRLRLQQFCARLLTANAVASAAAQ